MSDPTHHRLTVPGNLLLAGEYAVLEQGGLGLACAVERRVHVTWQPSDQVAITTRFEDQEKTWSPQDTKRQRLLSPLWDSLTLRFGSQINELQYTLTLDSTDLARQDGQKLGLGSSAAAAVAATGALCYLISGTRPTLDEVFQIALAAHRQTQRGRGSGYDLACSTFGGLGLFTGGKVPTWAPLSLTHVPAFKLIDAPNPVSTQQAIARWAQWKTVYPTDWARTLHQSQHIVSSLAQSRDGHMFEATLAQAATMGKALGQDIGVWDSANNRFMEAQTKTGLVKALGAGNELLAQCCDPQDPERALLASKGLIWS